VNLPCGIYLWDLFMWTLLYIGDRSEANMVDVFEWLDPHAWNELYRARRVCLEGSSSMLSASMKGE
jgi:hypothetical protein